MTSELHTFTYQDLPVHYRKTGRGRPLLFLHGWGSKSDVMCPLAERLSTLRTCYLPDLPGFGQSPVPKQAWSVGDYADMIESFIRSLDVDKVDLLVHSFGGRIALKLLARPDIRERTGKVLIAAGAGMRPRRGWRYYGRKYLAKALKLPFVLLPKPYRDRALRNLRSTTLWKKLGSSDYQQLEGTMREIFVQTVTEHLDHLLPKISGDILLVWGDQDSATPLYQGKRMENGIDGAALVTIEGAGHYAFLDRPAHFARIARAFFSVED